MLLPYANFDKELHDLVQAIWKETPDIRILSDFVKGLPVQIISSQKHPDKIGTCGTATSCGLLEGGLYVAVNFRNQPNSNGFNIMSQIFFFSEVRFLRHKNEVE